MKKIISLLVLLISFGVTFSQEKIEKSSTNNNIQNEVDIENAKVNKSLNGKKMKTSEYEKRKIVAKKEEVSK